MARQKSPPSPALLEVIRQRMAGHPPKWLAEEVYKRTQKFHDASYFSHALSGDQRIAPIELKATCEILDIDPLWAFEESGWPQVIARPVDDAKIAPVLRYALEPLPAEDQERLAGALPHILALLGMDQLPPTLRAARGKRAKKQ